MRCQSFSLSAGPSGEGHSGILPLRGPEPPAGELPAGTAEARWLPAWELGARGWQDVSPTMCQAGWEDLREAPVGAPVTKEPPASWGRRSHRHAALRHGEEGAEGGEVRTRRRRRGWQGCAVGMGPGHAGEHGLSGQCPAGWRDTGRPGGSRWAVVRMGLAGPGRVRGGHIRSSVLEGRIPWRVLGGAVSLGSPGVQERRAGPRTDWELCRGSRWGRTGRRAGAGPLQEEAAVLG